MRKVIYILIAALSALMASCTHKELCYDHSHVVEVNVGFIWDKARQATPKSMSVYFFPESGGESIRYEFVGHNGGQVRLARGKYHAICLNSDTRNVRIDNPDDFNSFCISTKGSESMYGLATFGITANDIPQVKGTEEERVVLSPEMIWSSSMTDIEIKNDNQDIIFHPERIITNFTVEIRNVRNLKWVNGISGTISSMSGGYHSGKWSLSEECVTIPFAAVMDQEASTITGSFSSFGHCPSIDRHHFITIYAILANESKWYYSFDVTDQVHEPEEPEEPEDPEEPLEIHIILEELPFPKPVVNGGGFKPEVGEWKEVEINISM